jgi:hypothetical protein
MNRGPLLAVAIGAATALLLVLGVIHPVDSAVAYAGGGGTTLVRSNSNAEAAVSALGTQMKLQAWDKAYESLANKAEFTQAQYVSDVTGSALSLRTYATLDSFEVQPLHQSASDADMKMKLYWSSVVGIFEETRTLHLVKAGDHWAVNWPLVPEPRVPPQVIPVNYLRWDVVYSGSADDWGAQDVEAPHVRIVDMHPVNRADGVLIMGELLNEDVIPAYVTVRATIFAKDGTRIEGAGTFDLILHTLLPKQVTPFVVAFPGVPLSKIGSIKMEPLSVLVSATADPIIEVQNQTFDASSPASLKGQLSNQSGHVVNVAHVLSTFYDKNGQVVWVGSEYIDRALQPETPTDFRITVPADLAKQISSQRTVVATYVAGSSL